MAKHATLWVLVLGVLGLVGAGCGGSMGGIPSASMPQGGSYTGVWHSPQYGEMQMVQTGQQVVGEYTKDERRGRIQGTVRGGVMSFEWSEQRELVAGRPITTRGRGYFVYEIGGDGDHYIRGQWGTDNNHSGGGPWNAVRDRRREPRMNEGGSGGNENVEAFDTASDSGGGGGGASGGSDDDDLDLGGL